MPNEREKDVETTTDDGLSSIVVFSRPSVNQFWCPLYFYVVSWTDDQIIRTYMYHPMHAVSLCVCMTPCVTSHVVHVLNTRLSVDPSFGSVSVNESPWEKDICSHAVRWETTGQTHTHLIHIFSPFLSMFFQVLSLTHQTHSMSHTHTDWRRNRERHLKTRPGYHFFISRDDKQSFRVIRLD